MSNTLRESNSVILVDDPQTIVFVEGDRTTAILVGKLGRMSVFQRIGNKLGGDERLAVKRFSPAETQSAGQSKEIDVAAGARAPVRRSQISSRYAASWTVPVVDSVRNAMKFTDSFYPIGNLEKKCLRIRYTFRSLLAGEQGR